MKKQTSIIVLVIFSILATYALAAPEGPDSISRGPSENSGTGPSGVQQQAEGGNVTPLLVTGSPQTNRWQGFFGNISGTLALDDANSNSMYQWQLISPQGEIYAVNNSAAPAWTQVKCLNLTVGAPDNVTITALENSYGMATNDPDGVNETFNRTFSGSFTVGTSVTIDSDDACRTVSLNVNDAYQESVFDEVILTDNTSVHNVIYTAILENNNQNFRTGGETSDFQMIVGENGATAGILNYWFYVELS